MRRRRRKRQRILIVLLTNYFSLNKKQRKGQLEVEASIMNQTSGREPERDFLFRLFSSSTHRENKKSITRMQFQSTATAGKCNHPPVVIWLRTTTAGLLLLQDLHHHLHPFHPPAKSLYCDTVSWDVPLRPKGKRDTKECERETRG